MQSGSTPAALLNVLLVDDHTILREGLKKLSVTAMNLS